MHQSTIFAYSKEELEHFKNLLLEKRQEAVEDDQEMKESIEDQQNVELMLAPRTEHDLYPDDKAHHTKSIAM
jgi:RNA polymerase-binding transcription factor DksA